MNKPIAFVLTVAVALSLCGCKNSEVKEVESMIANIAEINYYSQDSIIAAEEAYNALSDKDKANVENYSVLIEARNTYDEKLEVVELTLDNWNEYFEIKVNEMWKEDAFGTANQVRQTYWFAVKDEYKNSVVMDMLGLKVAYTSKAVNKEFEIDWENRSYSIGQTFTEFMIAKSGNNPFGNESNTTIKKYTWPDVNIDMKEALIKERHNIENLDAPEQVLFDMVDGVCIVNDGAKVYATGTVFTDSINNIVTWFVSDVESIEITRIEGTLVLFKS